MTIELESLIKLLVKEQDNKLKIDIGYATFLNHIREFKKSATYDFHLTYAKGIKKFYDLENIEFLNDINNQVILKFIDYEKQHNNKNTTINKKITHIKYMLDYLHKMDLIPKHKITIEKLPTDETRFKNVALKDLKQILSVSNKMNQKYQLQLLLLVNTGIRRTELYNIKLNDINLSKQYITLSHTKNGHQRNIYINEKICNLIKSVSKNNIIYLFENKEHTTHENPDNINYLKKEIYRLTGLHITPHMLRHTYATTLLEKGADFESIRLLLGHSDYSMIKRYVHIKNKKLAELSTSLYIDLELPTD